MTRPVAWRLARWGAVILLSALFIAALRRMDIGRVWSALGSVNPGWIGAALLCYALILPLWALQWFLLSPPVASRTRRRMLAVVCMTSTVLNTTPMLVGEATGILLLVTRGGLDRGAALSVLAMDQLFVGLAKLAVLSAAAVLLPLPLWMTRAVASLVVAVGLLLLALVVAAWRHADLRRVMDARLPARFRGRLASFGPALAPLRSPRLSGSVLLLALAKKAAEVLAIICIQRAFGVVLPLSSAVLVLAALNLATLLPLTPGNVGLYEAAVVFAYTWLGVPPEQALSMAVVQHACYVVALALPGYRWAADVTRRAPAA